MLVYHTKDGARNSFYMSNNLATNLNAYVKGVMTKNATAVFLFDGRSGQGKTTLSSQVGVYINQLVRTYYKKKDLKDAPEFTLDNLCWTPDSFIDKVKSVNKKGDIIILDESMIISNRSSMSEMNRAIIIMLSMIRSKNIFIIFNVNSIFDLDKNLPLHRAEMLVNLYPRDGKFASRGAYQVIPSAGGKLKYLYISGKKYYDYSKARKAFSDTFPSYFPFDEKEYERRKQKDISNYNFGKTNSASITKESRDKCLRWIRDTHPEMTLDDIGRMAGVSIKTVYRALKTYASEQVIY